MLTWVCKVHDEYAKLTKDKNKDSRSVEAIKEVYEKGELRVPCVQLTCLKYEYRLLEGLATNKSVSTPCSSVPAGPTPNVPDPPVTITESISSNSKRPRRTGTETMKALSYSVDRIYPDTGTLSHYGQSGDEGDEEWPAGPNGTKRQRCI